jgi:hypothetical protein
MSQAGTASAAGLATWEIAAEGLKQCVHRRRCAVVAERLREHLLDRSAMLGVSVEARGLERLGRNHGDCRSNRSSRRSIGRRALIGAGKECTQLRRQMGSRVVEPVG